MLYEVITLTQYIDHDERIITCEDAEKFWRKAPYNGFSHPYDLAFSDTFQCPIFLSFDKSRMNFALLKKQFFWYVITSYSIHYTKLYDE